MRKQKKNCGQHEIVLHAASLHQYVFCTTVNVQTDHRPLDAIFKKPLGSAMHSKTATLAHDAAVS